MVSVLSDQACHRSQEPLLYRCSLNVRACHRYANLKALRASQVRLDWLFPKLDFSLSDQQVPMFLRLVNLALALYLGQFKKPTSSLTHQQTAPSSAGFPGHLWPLLFFDRRSKLSFAIQSIVASHGNVEFWVNVLVSYSTVSLISPILRHRPARLGRSRLGQRVVDAVVGRLGLELRAGHFAHLRRRGFSRNGFFSLCLLGFAFAI